MGEPNLKERAGRKKGRVIGSRKPDTEEAGDEHSVLIKLLSLGRHR